MGAAEIAMERWRRWADGPRQRVTRWWTDYATTDVRLSDVRLCVEIVLGDVVIRVATSPVRTISGVSDEQVDYEPGILGDEPVLEAGVRLGEPAAASRSVNIAIPSNIIDGWALLRRGHTLAGVAEVSWQVDGMDNDLRLVLMRGDVVASGFGADGEAMQLVISDPRMTEFEVLPAAVIDGTRWPNAREDAVGRRAPVVINGYPRVEGLVVDTTTGGAGTVLVCADPRLEFEEIVAGEFNRFWADGSQLGYPPGNAYAPWSFGHERDGSGLLCLTADLSSSVGPFTGDERFHVDVQLETGTMAGALAVAERLVRLGSRGRDLMDPVLWAQAEATLPRMTPRVLFDADGETAPRVVQWLEGALSADIPSLHWCFDGAGFGPVVIDWRSPVSGRLVVGEWPVIERATLVTEEGKDKCFDEFEVRWSEDRMLGRWQQVTRRDPSTSDVLGYLRDTMGGPRPHPTVEAHLTFDAVMATYAIEWLAAHRSWPSYAVELVVAPAASIQFRIGQNVDFVDRDLGMTDERPARATIERKVYARGAARMTLRVWHPYLVGAVALP